jgi:hypothetical protein
LTKLNRGVFFMYKRPIFAVLLGLTLLFPDLVRADDIAAKNDKPAVTLRLASLDHLRGDFRYLAEVVGQAEKAKQFDELIKSTLGDKGLRGIDPKKPIGAYGWVGDAGVDSKVVVLVPIADEKAFLDLLSTALEIKPEKGDDGVYTIPDKAPFPIHFRFANHYVYVTIGEKDVLAKDKLLEPAAVLPAGQTGTLSVMVNIDQIPNNLKGMAVGAVDNQAAGLKETAMEGHTAAQKKLRDGTIDEIVASLKSLFNHGGEATLRLDIDRKLGDLTLTASVAGKAGSQMAKTIRDLGQVKSLTAALLRPNSALKIELNASLPEKLRELLAPALQDAKARILAKTKDENELEMLNTLLKAVMPTIQAAELDTAIDVRGPSDKGLYTVVGAIKIKDGANLEKTFRKTASRVADKIQLDADKAGQISIHRINPDKDIKPGALKTIGANPVYVAFRKDVLFVSAGDNGLSAVKEALTAAPATGKVVELQMVLARLTSLFDDAASADMARKVFGDDKDGGRFRLTVEGGNALTLRLSIKAKVIDYIHRVEKAKKE